MVEWVKDVDSGELFPVYNVRDLDIPEHLKEVSTVEVDYNKTREKTITQLQEDLIVAQEQIKLMKATTFGNDEEIIIAKKVEPTIISDDVEFHGISKAYYFRNIFFIIIACVVVLIVGFLLLKNNVISFETVEQTAEIVEETATEKENINELYEALKKALPIAITVVGVRYAVRFMMITIHNV